MKKMTSAELRTAFLEFFRQHGHAVQPSSSLIPGNDPTLLFTNAGMVQFKDVFLGREKLDFTRATTSQRCVRAGGKHNDLENVGYTARHHTFFEMLGNFSFGDYFKRDAIHFAWDFLTKELGIPAERLWVTVFDEDSEAEAIWLEDVKINPHRFSRIGAKDNFWSMGDVGPCGPCTEIFYDHGEHVAGGPPGSPDEDGDRYIEVWNLVFMQYDRDKEGNLTPLPAPSVDTGMGLERIAAVLQGVHSNYEIDLFQNLLKVASQLANNTELSNSSLRVIADHIRSCAFLIADGVLPSNEGRGYVLRRIIRRAIRHGYRLGIQDTFFYKLVAPLVAEMGGAYPELAKAQEQVERVLKKEEERFAETLGQGMKILEACVAKLDGHVIPGDVVFLLYDTYGFPVDLTADFARENNLTVDHAGFEIEMTAQRDRARAGGSFAADYDQDIRHDSITEFTGYHSLDGSVQILGLFKKGQAVDALEAGDEGVLILDQTPFYAESGGQAGDTGLIEVDGAVFEVYDTQKQGGQLFLHKGKVLQGAISQGQACEVSVNADLRKATERNHSATHLLHAALRQVLGDHVAQKGSQVNAERLRFDFSHFEPMTAEELAQIEHIVNQQIRANHAVAANVMAKDDAVKAGAMALFGEKYGDNVRMIEFGNSKELCGGIHVKNSAEIWHFKIISEGAVAAGIRRIEAITGDAVKAYYSTQENTLTEIKEVLKNPQDVLKSVASLQEDNTKLKKELEQLLKEKIDGLKNALVTEFQEINGISFLAKQVDLSMSATKDLAQALGTAKPNAFVFLTSIEDNAPNIHCYIAKELVAKQALNAGTVIRELGKYIDGNGGGQPFFASGKGKNVGGIQEALEKAVEFIK